jgi:hypothetical protein
VKGIEEYSDKTFDHLRDITKMIELPKGAGCEIDDVEL